MDGGAIGDAVDVDQLELVLLELRLNKQNLESEFLCFDHEYCLECVQKLCCCCCYW